MPSFFMPDGDGGHLPADQTEKIYQQARAQAEVSSFWAGTFTERRVFAITSRHNGSDYEQRVGDLTSDRLLVLAILESIDEQGRQRFVVQSIEQTVHVDPGKAIHVSYFDD